MAGYNHTHNDTISGTLGGTLLAVITQLDGSDIIRTLILASLGAIASFVVSHFCKWCLSKVKSQYKKPEI